MNPSLQEFLSAYHSGTATRAYEFLGCHPEARNGREGFVFRVWAPNAEDVHVVGQFNRWNPADLPMDKISQGIWEGWSPNATAGSPYKYLVRHRDGTIVYKADPVGFRACRAPETNSIVCGPDSYQWHDSLWFARSARRSPLDAPLNIYELHLGSWQRKEDGSFYSYAEIAPKLAAYVREMGYTHVELMPLAGYPFDPSWGYQVTHYFSPTCRYGTPGELKYLIDTLHQADIGVILDWVPAHFPKDEAGLYEFDGTCAYELSDPRMNEHPDWTTRIFDFGKPEVKSFLISNAVYWLREFHADGIRVDAVSAMLYLDYGRSEYVPNRFGGRENLEAIAFLRELNAACFAVRKNVIMAAEESTAFPLVTKPACDGGLGFLFKWNMGWMNDTLRYMSMDPIFRKYHHDCLTFSMTYAFSENYILPLSHDEVVHGKHSLIGKMPGDYFWKFAGLRALRGYQMVHPGKKLSFMGNEFAQFTEWDHARQLDWLLLDFEMHWKMQLFHRDLNRFYLENRPLWENDPGWEGYRWVQPHDCDSSLIAFLRVDRKGREMLCILNFTPVLRENYRLGIPKPGTWQCRFCSDDEKYGGTGQTPGNALSEPVPWGEYEHSALFSVPPMSLTVFSRKAAGQKLPFRRNKAPAPLPPFVN